MIQLQYVNFMSIENFFGSAEKVVLDNKKLELFLNGVMISQDCKGEIVKIYNSDNAFIGIGVCYDKKLKRKIII